MLTPQLLTCTSKAIIILGVHVNRGIYLHVFVCAGFVLYVMIL